MLCLLIKNDYSMFLFNHHLATGQVESEVVVEAASPVTLRRGRKWPWGG